MVLLLTSCANQEKAESALKEYIAKTYPPVTGYKVLNASCQNTDTDHNGFCSCDLSVFNAETKDLKVPNLECACGWLQVITDGCKLKKGTN